MNATPETVLDFWFTEIAPKQWWVKDAIFDSMLKDRFGDLLIQAVACELAHWRTSADGRLAEIIVLDQFSRNIHRDTPQAFSQDPQALTLSQEAVAQGALEQLSGSDNLDKRTFLLMPYMHSESSIVHEAAVQLFSDYTPQSNYEFELRHKAIIDRFGRYPHRNEILGRPSTEEETEFLQQPGSGF